MKSTSLLDTLLRLRWKHADAALGGQLGGCATRPRCRGFATETYLPPGFVPPPTNGSSSSSNRSHHPIPGINPAPPTPSWLDQPVMTTVYSFPAMEPLRFAPYPAQHLRLPLRRDILHRAVVYEGDKTRQGTASTKWRDEVHGSGRKLRPQKGTGYARLRDRGNPMLRGGGVAFGPKPRDFSTDLPRKVYDLAWRTALSYRYSKGELIVVDYDHNSSSGSSGSGSGSDIGRFAVSDIEDDHPGYVRQLFETHGWGKPHGRSLVVTYAHRSNLFRALGAAGEVGRALVRDEVDVKDLLELGRIIIEKRALDRILWDHQSDIVRRIPTAAGP